MNIDIIDIDTIDATTCKIDGSVFAKSGCVVSAYGSLHAQIDVDGETFIASIGSSVDGRRPDTQAGLLFALRSLLGGVSVPDAVGWPSAFPVSISISGAAGSRVGASGYNPKESAAYLACRAGTQIYVATTGNDSTGNGSLATPYLTVTKAVQVANAAGVPATIFCTASATQWGRTASTMGAQPTVDVAFVARAGGRVRLTVMDDTLTYAADSTFAGCFSTARTNVTRVFDRGSLDANGDMREYRLAPSQASYRTNQGTYWTDGTTLYIHHFEDGTITSANTEVLVVQSLWKFTGGKNIFVVSDTNESGWEFDGGSDGSLVYTNSTFTGSPKIFYVENAIVRYAGKLGAVADGIAVTSIYGIAHLKNVIAASHSKDGINAHNSGAPYSLILTENCVGRDNGKFASTSNNGLTIHEDVIGIDVCGRYERNAGGNVHNIGTSKMLCAGTYAAASRGDLHLGGSIPPTEFRAGNSCQMWLDGATAIASGGIALAAESTSQIKHRTSEIHGVVSVAIGATVTTY